MIRYFCDMCHDELEDYEIYTVTFRIPEVRAYFDSNVEELAKYIVCQNCSSKIKDFLIKGGEWNNDSERL